MICQNCGANNSEGTIFCVNCGTKIANPQQPAYPQSQQPTYQQPTYQQPAYQQPTYMVKPKIPGRGFGISAMVLGIIGLVYAFVLMMSLASLASTASSLGYYNYRYRSSELDEAVAALITGILIYAVMPLLATIFGFLARKRGYANGVSMSGLVLGILGLVFSVISIIIASSF